MPDLGYNPDHYTTPRTLTGRLHVEPDPPRWLTPVAIVLLTLAGLALVATDCGALWCW
jgi:hypothetical protein